MTIPQPERVKDPLEQGDYSEIMQYLPGVTVGDILDFRDRIKNSGGDWKSQIRMIMAELIKSINSLEVNSDYKVNIESLYSRYREKVLES